MSSRASLSLPALRPLRAPRAGLWLQHLRQMHRVWKTRRDLAELDPRLLRDIGLTESEARREISRAPWDPGPKTGRG